MNKVELYNKLKKDIEVQFPQYKNELIEGSLLDLFLKLSSSLGEVVGNYADNALYELDILKTNNINKLSKYAKSLTGKFLNYKKSAAYCKAKIYQTALFDQAKINSANINLSDINNVKLNDYLKFLDNSYLIKLNKGAIFTSNSNPGINFYCNSIIDFSINCNAESFYYDENNNIKGLIISKEIYLSSSTIKDYLKIIVGTKKFNTIKLYEENVIDIIDIKDENNNKWYIVDSLSDLYIINDEDNDKNFLTGSYGEPEKKINIIYPYKKVEKSIDDDGYFILTFGGGIDNSTNSSENYLAYNFGEIPQDGQTFIITTLVDENLKLYEKVNLDIGDIDTISYYESIKQMPSTFNPLKTLKIENIERVSGSSSELTADEYRKKIFSAIKTSDRFFSEEDFLRLPYIFPNKYGKIEKINVKFLNINGEDCVVLFVLGKDENDNLAPLNNTVKNNLMLYLKNKIPLGLKIYISDAVIINYGINLGITINDFLNEDFIIKECAKKIYDLLGSNNADIGKHINIENIKNTIINIKGISDIKSMQFIPKFKYDSNKEFYDELIYNASYNYNDFLNKIINTDKDYEHKIENIKKILELKNFIDLFDNNKNYSDIYFDFKDIEIDKTVLIEAPFYGVFEIKYLQDITIKIVNKKG